jgi:hypothetical protein
MYVFILITLNLMFVVLLQLIVVKKNTLVEYYSSLFAQTLNTYIYVFITKNVLLPF